MTREESAKETKRKIKAAKNGKEIALAMREHFRSYILPNLPIKKDESLLEMFDGNVLGTATRSKLST